MTNVMQVKLDGLRQRNRDLNKKLSDVKTDFKNKKDEQEFRALFNLTEKAKEQKAVRDDEQT